MRTQFDPALENVSSSRGAPMGRPHWIDTGPHPRLRLFRVVLLDGAYDTGGAYWGGPGNLWCVYAPDDSVRLFYRSGSRKEAAAKCRADLPTATFIREP